MNLTTLLSIAFALVTIFLLFEVLSRRTLLAGPGGKALALVAVAVLPAVATTFGMNAHLEASKSTEFCLSCHVMEPYGESLRIDDQSHLPAAHFQNSRVPRDHACYSCHTTYTLYGDAESKWKGLRHLWINYVGTIPERIELYEPFQNRECLHCHGGARTFEAVEFHTEYRSEIASNETSCLECHEVTHDVENLDQLEKWNPNGD